MLMMVTLYLKPRLNICKILFSLLFFISISTKIFTTGFHNNGSC